jgi:hypothetical protein
MPEDCGEDRRADAVHPRRPQALRAAVKRESAACVTGSLFEMSAGWAIAFRLLPPEERLAAVGSTF